MTEGTARVSDQPEAEVRLGRIKAVIWANAGENGERWHTVQLLRLYRDGEQWRSTHSFGRNDLLVVAKVADLAHSKVCELAAGDPERESTEEETPAEERGRRECAGSGDGDGGGAGRAAGGRGGAAAPGCGVGGRPGVGLAP